MQAGMNSDLLGVFVISSQQRVPEFNNEYMLDKVRKNSSLSSLKTNDSLRKWAFFASMTGLINSN
jgi:hypothetical protein